MLSAPLKRPGKRNTDEELSAILCEFSRNKGLCGGHIIMFDSGKKFVEHDKVAQELKADIYFAHPYLSWERGLNENSGGNTSP